MAASNHPPQSLLRTSSTQIDEHQLELNNDQNIFQCMKEQELDDNHKELLSASNDGKFSIFSESTRAFLLFKFQIDIT